MPRTLTGLPLLHRLYSRLWLGLSNLLPAREQHGSHSREIRLRIQDEAGCLVARLTGPRNLAGLGAAFRFVPPLQEHALSELQWYIEEYPRWRFDPERERAERVERRLEGWGRALFQVIFPAGPPRQLWKRLREAGGGPLLLTIESDTSSVLRLPWELLMDAQGWLFAQGVMIRRAVVVAPTNQTAPADQPVRILLVISRPNDCGFLDPRATAGALLDSAESSRQPGSVVEVLRPPTWQALRTRLEDPNLPAVQILHFDGHGSFEKGEGKLEFEGATGQSDPISADDLAALLSGKGIKLVVLEACRSAYVAPIHPLTAIAPRLLVQLGGNGWAVCRGTEDWKSPAEGPPADRPADG